VRHLMDPLPYEPAFPVMGLDRSYRGKRRLGVWNLESGLGERDELLLEVDLWHGYPPDPPWVMVCTHVNREGFDRPEVLSPNHSGIRSAATGAIGPAISMSPELDVHTPIWEWATNLGEPPWERRQIRVEGEQVPCSVMQWQDIWSAVADLGAVSVGVCGQGVDLDEVGLEPVNERLDRYAHRPRPPESLQRLGRALRSAPPPEADPPPAHDERLDAYRDPGRAARVLDERGVIGQVLIRSSSSWEDVSRLPWVRQWEAREVPWCALILDDGGGHMWSVPAKRLEATLADWAQGRFPLPDEVSGLVAGKTLSLEWLDDQATRRLRARIEFGYTAD
jgi:hypothetical protein